MPNDNDNNSPQYLAAEYLAAEVLRIARVVNLENPGIARDCHAVLAEFRRRQNSEKFINMQEWICAVEDMYDHDVALAFDKIVQVIEVTSDLQSQGKFKRDDYWKIFDAAISLVAKTRLDKL